MSLRCQVRVTLNNIPREKAEAVRRALDPDNVDFPEDLGLEMRSAGGGLVFDFKSSGDMRKLVGTVDEVLEHVQVALRVIG